MNIIKASFRIIVGVLFGVVSTLALTPAFAAFATDQGDVMPIIMMLVVLLCGALSFEVFFS